MVGFDLALTVVDLSAGRAEHTDQAMDMDQNLLLFTVSPAYSF